MYLQKYPLKHNQEFISSHPFLSLYLNVSSSSYLIVGANFHQTKRVRCVVRNGDISCCDAPFVACDMARSNVIKYTLKGVRKRLSAT